MKKSISKIMIQKNHKICLLIIVIIILTIEVPLIHGEQNHESKTKSLSFIDPNNDPKYYLDRYYNEPKYRDWFDRNYPEYTIEEAVGHISEKDNTLQNQFLPNAEALSDNSTNDIVNNNETSQVILAISALGILFGATYGIKRKVDDNSRQISINRDKIKQKIIKPIIGSNPLEILQTRLAKGEITIEEYYKIKKELD